MYIIYDSENWRSAIFLIWLCIIILFSVIMLYVMDNRIKELTEKVNNHIELQQVTVKLIKQSAVTQNAVLEAMGVKIDESDM